MKLRQSYDIHAPYFKVLVIQYLNFGNLIFQKSPKKVHASKLLRES